MELLGENETFVPWREISCTWVTNFWASRGADEWNCWEKTKLLCPGERFLARRSQTKTITQSKILICGIRVKEKEARA